MSAFEAFVTVHQYQLAAIPQDLWLPLFMKLGEDYLDAGNYVELHYGDPLEGYSLHLKADQSMAKNSEIFLVDHAWTTTPETARKELLGNPKLLERLEGMMDIEKDDEPELSDAEEEEIEHDDDAIQTVAEQADVSLDEAKKALEEEKYEVVNAIMRLTFSEDFKKESDRLQEQVMGQLIASGKAQEKEDKVKKEKEERLKKRHEAWMNDRVNSVCRHMWSYLQTYSYSILQQDGQPTTQTAWYMNDEVGSALAHASDPNMVCIPFIFSRGASGMIPYSVMFPIKDINAGEILTCDLVPKKLERPLDRAAYLLAFESRTVREERRVHDEELIEAYKKFQAQLEQKHFIPDVQTAQPSEQASADGVVHVYSTTQYVRDHLKLAGAKFTGSPDSADLLWYSQDFEEWDKLKPGQTINQYRYESCLTQKQHLADLIQDTWGSPSWMPNTYNLTTQLAEFVGNYLANSKSSEPNLWITKPWNFARGIEIDVDDDLAYLIRQHDSPTPKIVQQYITKPSLYNHKKYDLRYIVLVRPGGTVCIYKMFWVRLANKRFNLKDLKDYECQFTVMNYSKFPMTQLDYKSFIHNFEKQHQTQWDPIQKEVDHAIRSVFDAALSRHQPVGLMEDGSPAYTSFGMYGVDVMLTENNKPVVLEVNFSPDCTRACQFDPEFINNVFRVAEPRFGEVERGLESFRVL